MTNFSEIPVQLSDEFPRLQDKRVGISKMFLSFITLSLYIRFILSQRQQW